MFSMSKKHLLDISNIYRVWKSKHSLILPICSWQFIANLNPIMSSNDLERQIDKYEMNMKIKLIGVIKEVIHSAKSM